MVKSLSDRLFQIFVYLVSIVACLVCIVPMLHVLNVSLMSYVDSIRSGIALFPTSISLESYRYLLEDPYIVTSFKNTVFITLVGTALSLLFSAMMGYSLSRKDLPGVSVLMSLVAFTMLFSGGMIPTYYVVRELGLINSLWAMILPVLISPFNVIILRSFFRNIENSLIESAYIDGAGEFRIFAQIVMPVSKPVLATIGLFYGVGYWNTFFTALFYITKNELNPLQVVVRGLIAQATISDYAAEQHYTMGLRMAAVVISAVPIIAVYPFLQRYFVKGMMIGAVKG
ncbi:carbohydrate ABC transporter permease [Paenibacillus ferrarius]|uniref:carbohydrate ABC transporter permease n=1 Tax=Paenibacillus ferrarius TaxID=1469647 RepID=UPI003D2C9441